MTQQGATLQLRKHQVGPLTSGPTSPTLAQLSIGGKVARVALIMVAIFFQAALDD